jgi:hypothetical protein
LRVDPAGRKSLLVAESLFRELNSLFHQKEIPVLFEQGIGDNPA